MHMEPTERLKRMLTVENLWIYILYLLSKNKIYAYELPRKIEEKFGWKPELITTYFVLYRLESQKYIESKYDERRKYYKITKKGREELRKGKRILLETLEKIKDF